MARPIVNLPKDRHLKCHKLNDVSSWNRDDAEWVGSREKFIVSPPNSKTRYMVKFPKYGENEIKIELFNCYLGINLNLNVASYFPCIYKSKKGIITKDFLNNSSQLWEMKELVCHYSNNPNLEEKFGRNPDVLKEHNIDNIYLILDTEFGKKILHGFFCMVGFDCLIGHGDRHWSNYGVVVDEAGGNLKYKFSPLYDTASGYLLEMTDDKLQEMLVGGTLDKEDWYKPKKKGLCKIICNDDLKTNHIELFEYIIDNQDFKNYASSLILAL